MSERKGRPGLSSRPPGPRDLENFMAGAERPRTERPSPARPQAPAPSPANKIPASKIPVGSASGQVRFPLRLDADLHEKLRWLDYVSGGRRMNGLINDLLRPALEEAVRRKRKERGA